MTVFLLLVTEIVLFSSFYEVLALAPKFCRRVETAGLGAVEPG